MGKYQEALDYLKGGNMFGELSNEALESIEALIDKETPMKPNGNNCMRCGSTLKHHINNHAVRFNRCQDIECGQLADWT